MDSYKNLLSSESYDLHTSLVVSSAESLATFLSFNLSAGDYNNGEVSCDSIYSNGEPLGLDLEPLYYDPDNLQDTNDSDGASVFSLGLDGDNSQYGQWYFFTFVRPAQTVVQVSNNTKKWQNKTKKKKKND